MEIKKLFHGRNYEKVPFLQIRLLSQYIGDDNQKMKLNATFTNPDYELIKNLYISSNDFILFYETTSETELNSVPDQISTPPQLCHTKGAPELSTLQSDDKKDILEKNQRSPDFHTNQELQIMKPYLTEPIFTRVNVKPDIFAFIDRSFNPQFSSEF